MKTERRHELEQNELADRVGASFEQVAPYGKQIAALLVAVLVVVLGYRWYTGNIRAKDEKAWEAYYQAMAMRSSDASGGQNLRRSKLSEVISNKNFSGSPAIVWARLSLADDELERGIDHLFNNRTEGEKDLEKAKEDYQGVLKEGAKLNAKHSAVLLPRAKMGLARSLESLGDVKDALKTYKEVETEFPLTAYKVVARKRVTSLENDKAENFYDWLREQEVRPSVPAGGGTPGLRPDFDPLGTGTGTVPGLDFESLKSPKGILTDDLDAPKKTPKSETPKVDPAKTEVPEAPKGDADLKKDEAKKDDK